MSKSTILKHALLAFACSFSLCIRALADAPKAVNVPAGDLTTALEILAKQSGAELVYRPGELRGLRTRGVKGTLSAEEAVSKLLQGTKLTLTTDRSRVLLITAPGANGADVSSPGLSSPATIENGTGEAGAVRVAEIVSSGNTGNPETSSASAGDVEQTGAESKKPVLEEVIVTGSNIPTTPDAAAVPVIVLGPEQIAQTGVNSNVLEILRKAIPSFAGRSNAGNSNANNTNQNTAGGSQIQLRNLDTLVLINGRRIATSGANGIGGKNFVDINQIPTAAIDRIEVLADGASAIYGSDAIGGVINVILKNNYQGAEVGGRFGGAKGGYNEDSAYFVAGTEAAQTHITLSGSWSKTDPLAQSSRSFSSPLTGRSSAVPGAVGVPGGTNPGALLASGLNSPSDRNPTGIAATATSLSDLIANGTYVPRSPASIASTYDLAQFQQLLLKQDQRSIIATVNSDLLGDKLTVFGDAMYSQTKSFTQFLPLTSSLSVPAGAPYNPLTKRFSQVTFADWQRSKQFFNDAKGLRVTAGLRGEITAKWDWESGFVYNENKLRQDQANVIYAPNIARAIAGGFDAQGNAIAGGAFSRVAGGFSESNPFVIAPALDPFARAGGINPASVANIFGTERIDLKSRLESFDLKLVGLPFDLPGGTLGVAVGINWRKEILSGNTDPNGYNTGPTAGRWSGATRVDPFSSSRTIKAAFAEVRVPIAGDHWNVLGAHALELIAAVRTENYSDAGKSTVPKYGFRWQPVDSQFTVRGTYSKSFTAPTLFALSGPTGTRIIGSGVIQSVFGLPGLGFQGEDGNNPNLRPSEAWSRSLGLAFAPKAIKGLTLTADFVSVNQSGFPGGIGFANILQSVDRLGSASPFAQNVAFGNFPGRPGSTPITAPGTIGSYLRGGGDPLNLYAVDYFVNLAGVKVRSWNVTAGYDLPTANYGQFVFNTSGAIFSHYEFQALSDQPFYEYAGFATNGGTGVQGTLPKYRFYSTLDWRHRNWEVTVGNTFTSSVEDIGVGGTVFANSKTLKRIPVSRYVTWDLQFAYTNEMEASRSFVHMLKLTLGVNNLTDKLPPLSPQAFTDVNADIATYSPIGRLIYGAISVKF